MHKAYELWIKNYVYIVHTMPYTLILYETPKMSINKQPLKIEKKRTFQKQKDFKQEQLN